MTDHGSQIKDDNTYEALRRDGASKQKAARIANAQAASKTGDIQTPASKGGSAPPYEEWQKTELYERAKTLEITGRSDMNKAELIDALRNN